MTRNFVFLATVAAVAVVPQIAQASCSGNACSAFSATAVWSSSQKQVNTVLTNRDSTKPVHLRLCITVEGKCSPFDLTLPPGGNMTKSVSVPGGGAPPKFSVDVSTAEFPASQTTGQGAGAAQGAAAAQGSGAIKAIETPYGQITYFATHDEGLNLTKAAADFVKGRDLYQKLAPRVTAFNDAYQKVGSLKEIEAEIRKTVAADPLVQVRADIAQGVRRQFENLAHTFRLVGELADNAARDLSVTEKEVEAARDRQEAAQLRAEAARQRQQLSLLIYTISAAVTAADNAIKLDGGDVIGVAGNALSAADKVADLFTNSGELAQRAQELETKARQISADAAAERFKNAGQILSTLKVHLADLKPTLQGYKADYQKAVARTERLFDKDNASKGNANKKGRFSFANLTALIAEAKAINALAAETRQATNAAREYMRAYRSARKDWMADPASNAKVMQRIFDISDLMTSRTDQMRQATEKTLAQLQDTYAKAMQIAGQ